jgi:peptidoglycan hydrolase CwlO-like protein
MTTTTTAEAEQYVADCVKRISKAQRQICELTEEVESLTDEIEKFQVEFNISDEQVEEMFINTTAE